MGYWRHVIRLAFSEIVNEKRQAALGAVLPTALTLFVYWLVDQGEFGSSLLEIVIAVAVGISLSLLLFVWKVVTIPPRLASQSANQQSVLRHRIQGVVSREETGKAWKELEVEFTKLCDGIVKLFADFTETSDGTGTVISAIWNVRGGTEEIRERLLVLATRAGHLLVRNPQYRERFPFLENAPDPDRWLGVVIRLGKTCERGVYGSSVDIQGQTISSFVQRTIKDLALDSALVCFKLANEPSP